MKPTELHLYDLDDTLLVSPRPEGPDPLWWHQAYSLEPIQDPPGFDHRWILPTIVHARRMQQRPGSLTAVLTARIDARGLRREVERLVQLTGLSFDAVQLRPVRFQGTSMMYKAAAVAVWLHKHPTIKVVTFHDDQEMNLASVGQVVQMSGARYIPVKTPNQRKELG